MLFGKYINKYYLKYILYLVVGISALLLVDAAQLQIPELFGGLIDSIKDNNLNYEMLASLVKEMLIIAAILFSCRFIWRICLFGAGIKVEADIRLLMFKKIETLGQDYFSDNKTGAIMALFTNDLQTIRRCFGQGSLMLIDALFLGILAISYMYKINHLLTVCVIIPLLLLGIIGTFIMKYMSRKFKLRQEAFEDLSDFTNENFSGLNVVKAFVKETNELRRFAKINKHNEKINVEYTKLMVKIELIVNFCINLIIISILGVGSYLIINRQELGFTVGKLTEYISYFSSLIWPVMALAQLANLTSQGYASLGRITKLLDEEPSVKNENDSVVLDKLTGKITVNNLSFKYPETENEVLKNVSFNILPGEKIGVIGKTGCGKTTLVDLLLRMYNVNDNEILLDDYDIMNLSLHTIRENISFVPQDNFLFGTTVRENISFGTTDPKFSVEEAGMMAGVHEDIMDFTEGYDTELGERGVTVSGGQKQRISIARALMKNAPILILDDAVSAVDTKTEDTILNNLKENFKDSTIILTAHRISTVQDLDKILVLDEGQVVGFDNHVNLYNNCPLYKEMVDLQKLEAKIEGDDNE